MFSRSPSASIRKFERIGIVVLRSTTLCVAVSSFTKSWRLTVISIADPCTAGFSASVSTIGIVPPSLQKHSPALAPAYNTLRPRESACVFFCLIVFTFCLRPCVENQSTIAEISAQSNNPSPLALCQAIPFATIPAAQRPRFNSVADHPPSNQPVQARSVLATFVTAKEGKRGERIKEKT